MPRGLEAALLAIGMGGLAVALGSGFLAVRRSNSPLATIFLAVGAAVAAGTFVAIYVLGRG
jgi:hypothetical protein